MRRRALPTYFVQDRLLLAMPLRRGRKIPALELGTNQDSEESVDKDASLTPGLLDQGPNAEGHFG